MARSESQVLKQVTAVNNKIRTLTGKLEAAWRERRDLYVEARNLTPPIPHARVAAAAGTTEAAVMQVIAKGYEAELTSLVSERLNGEATPKEVRTAVKVLYSIHGNHDAAVAAVAAMTPKQLRAITQS